MRETLTGKPQLNRVVNRRLILDRIRRVGRVSRAQLAELTAIRPPTVSAVIKELIEEGLVEEVGNGQSRGGRAPRLLSLAGKRARAVGFEVSETAIRAGVCDLKGNLIARGSVPYLPCPPQETVNLLHDQGTELLGGLGLSWEDIRGVGVALPGHLDPMRGIVRWSKPLEWKDVPFRQFCQECWGVDTDLVNDSMAGGLAAHFYEANSSVKNLIYLYIRFHVIAANRADRVHGVLGLGSGIILNGEPFHGEFGAAGEITTLVAHPMVDARDEDGAPFPSLEAFCDALCAGSASSVAAMDRVAVDMSHLVVHAVNFLEPGMMILGSDNSLLRDELLVRLQRILDEHRLLHEAGRTRLLASELGEYGVVRGAVVPASQRLFRMPRWT
ncbi:MAG TPA: ROK family transcriptional regulator [Phycisphaerae bacterium]|nr:ROK family transcriptional regulator [Phycisphaerales bacterium]HRX84856.1 ROK family transcriptional regulator [Phycisphaerae bacterium]